MWNKKSSIDIRFRFHRYSDFFSFSLMDSFASLIWFFFSSSKRVISPTTSASPHTRKKNTHFRCRSLFACLCSISKIFQLEIKLSKLHVFVRWETHKNRWWKKYFESLIHWFCISWWESSHPRASGQKSRIMMKTYINMKNYRENAQISWRAWKATEKSATQWIHSSTNTKTSERARQRAT